jgi:hypothetical protein
VKPSVELSRVELTRKSQVDKKKRLLAIVQNGALVPAVKQGMSELAGQVPAPQQRMLHALRGA